MKRIAVLALACAAVAVGTIGVAAAATLTVSTRRLGGSSLVSPVMFPTSVTVANRTGGVLGKPENGDIVTLVWSQQIDEATLCSGWSNASSTQSIQLQWSIIHSSGVNDSLKVTGTSSTCSGGFHVGTIDQGAAGYNTSTTSAVDFPTSTNALTVGASTTTLVVTLGGQVNGTAGTVSAGTAAIWTPDAALKDRSARNCGNNLARSTATVQF